MKCPKCNAPISVLSEVRKEFACRTCGAQLTSNGLAVNFVAVGVGILTSIFVEGSYCTSSGSVFSPALPFFCSKWLLFGGALLIAITIVILFTRVTAK